MKTASPELLKKASLNHFDVETVRRDFPLLKKKFMGTI